MNEKQETEIINQVKREVAMYGNCSLKQVANSLFYNNISLSQQKQLAKQLVKTNPYTTELKNGEIIVKYNVLFDEADKLKGDDLKLIKSLIAVIASVLAYILFHIFLPSL